MSFIPRFKRQSGISNLQKELDHVKQNPVQFVDVCGLAQARFEEIKEEEEREEEEESIYMALPDGSRLAQVIKDDSLSSIATQLKQLEAECKKSAAKKMQTWLENEAVALKASIKASGKLADALKTRLKTASSSSVLTSLEEELGILENQMDSEKRALYFPSSRISLGSNGLYIGLDDLWLETLSGSFSLSLVPGVSTSHIIFNLSGNSNSASGHQGLEAKLRLDGLKIKSDKSLLNLSLDTVQLELGVKLTLEIIYDVKKRSFSFKLFEVEILHFKGSFGLTRSIVAGILAMTIPIVKYKLLGLLPCELGQLIAELPRAVSIEGHFDISGKLPVEALQHAMFKNEKICHALGFTPLQMVMFVGLQKSMERKTIIKSVVDLIAYRRKYQNENQWEILKIFWDQACVVYYSRIIKLESSHLLSSEHTCSNGFLSFEKLLLGLDEVTNNPLEVHFSLSNVNVQITFNSFMKNLLSFFNRWSESIMPLHREDPLLFNSAQFVFLRIEKDIQLLQTLVATCKKTLSSSRVSVQLSLHGGAEGTLTALLDDVHALGSVALYTALPSDKDLGYDFAIPVMMNVRTLPEGIINVRTFHLGCSEMLERANFERFKIEYEKDPEFPGLHSLREYCSVNEHKKISSKSTKTSHRPSALLDMKAVDEEEDDAENQSSRHENSAKYLSMPAQSTQLLRPRNVSQEINPLRPFQESFSHLAQVQQEVTRKKKAFEVKVGWINKEGHIFKSWNQRWFVLNKGVLRYYKSAMETFPYGQGLKGEISLGDYYTIPISEKRFELRSSSEEGGKNFLMETLTESDCTEWMEVINFQMRYWHTDLCSALQYEDVGLAIAQSSDFPSSEEDKLHYFQKRMVSMHLRQSEHDFVEVEEILQQVASNDQLTAYELMQINVYRPKVEVILARPLTLSAGAVLFTAGVGPVAQNWAPAAVTSSPSSNKLDVEEEEEEEEEEGVTHRPSYLASTAQHIPGCPLLLQTSEHVKIQLHTNKVQIEVQLPKVLRFISLHLEDKQLFIHSLAMLSATHTESMALRMNKLAKALLAFVSTFLLLPNLSIFLNLAVKLASVGNTDTDIIESDDISLSLETPHSCQTDCMTVYLKFNVKDVIAEVLHLKELFLDSISGVTTQRPR